MFHVALYEPEIPPNTGNIARLCAATGASLHLIGRLGFHLDDRSLRRAGLDYWHAVTLHQHITFADFTAWRVAAGYDAERCFAFSAHALRPYTAINYRPGDALLFGSETRGLPEGMLARFGQRALTIPMPTRAVRSLNLANAVAIVLYEALRQRYNW